eukprot:gene15220-6424_t
MALRLTKQTLTGLNFGFKKSARKGFLRREPDIFWQCLLQQHSKGLSSRFVPLSGVVDATEEDLCNLENFVSNAKRLFVLTGAGVSTESGIRDYRSEGIGLYEISNHRPILHDDFLKKPGRRHRYWARNFAGWPVFWSKIPNKNHICLAEMEEREKIHWLVTQNVDGLHTKAGSKRVTELHGTSSLVHCLSCKREISRHELQEKLYKLNAGWEGVRHGQDAPDGDIVVDDNLIGSFKMLNCEVCNGILKPKIVFFGDNVPPEVKNFVNKKLDESDALLIIGSSTETYSSYRLALAAKQKEMPIAILNIGKTRSDHLADLKISAISGEVLPLLNYN